MAEQKVSHILGDQQAIAKTSDDLAVMAAHVIARGSTYKGREAAAAALPVAKVNTVIDVGQGFDSPAKLSKMAAGPLA